MKTLYQKLPEVFEYEDIANFLLENNVLQGESVKVGNNTLACWADDPDDLIEIRLVVPDKLHALMVGVLFSSGDAAQLYAIGNLRVGARKDRLDRIVRALGYRVKQVNKSFKVYSIQSGEYRDYKYGMIVERGRF